MELYYIYSDGCSCCKGYSEVACKVADALKIKCHKQTISIDGYNLRGVPTVIIVDDGGRVIYENVGNLPYDLLLKDIRENVK